MILDCSCSRLPLAAQELILTKEYINNFSINHIVYILSIIKEDINFFDIHKNPYVISKKVLLDVIEMYRLLEYSDSTNLRVVAVSKTLNLWHCRGKIFCKRSTTNEDNPAAIFTKTQLSKLSNITPSEVDREIKKLIYSY